MVRILVVDDEPAIVDSVREIVRLAGYGVATSYSGTGAVRSAIDFRPDILLSDILLPDLNGFELALIIKNTLPNCRLLLFSGQAATAQLAGRYSEVFASKGFQFVLLPKPIHPDVLLKEIQDAAGRPA